MDENKSTYPEYLKAYYKKAIECVHELRHSLFGVEIYTSLNSDENYFVAAQIFNTRLQQNPLAIVYCKTAAHVSIAYQIALKKEIPVRVRAGGHDHEGESSGTNVVVIDVSKMTAIRLIPKTDSALAPIAKIGAGNRFTRLTSKLADKNVMIAHGTCASVCITGFTLGGGWGPWTRKMGMNCEHLKGATLMLGNGEIIDIDDNENADKRAKDLLWALRGGGGMSYGIVTELRLQTFVLPDKLIKFELHWNHYDEKEDYPKEDIPTLTILKAWEAVIQATDTSQLIGTNLKINARPAVADFNYEQITHGCCMYGYWEGEKADLELFVANRFKTAVPPILKIDGTGGQTPKERYVKGKGLMSRWAREFAKVKEKLAPKGLLQGKPIPPDEDDPAPHKITSRFVNSEGLGAAGYEALLLSLTSSLVQPENRGWGLFTYVTLGAIVGDYYRNNREKADSSAFPYKDKLYTIQYQAWWKESNDKHLYDDPSQRDQLYRNINRAMDWIDAARECVIPNTSGAFISFKDNAVPTKVYFDKSYEKLKAIKIEHSKDSFNHLRTRKTII